MMEEMQPEVASVEQMLVRIKGADERTKALLEEARASREAADAMREELGRKLASIRLEIGVVTGRGGGASYADRLAGLPDRFKSSDAKALYGPDQPTAHYPMLQWAEGRKLIRRTGRGAYSKVA